MMTDARVMLGSMALVAARLVPIALMAPLFGGMLVPRPVRVLMGLAMSAVIVSASVGLSGPGMQVAALESLESDMLVLIAAKEVLVGALLGFIASLPLLAARSAGALMSTARDEPGGAASLAMPSTLLALWVFFTIDGHLLMIRALGASYQALPLLPPSGLAPAALPGLADAVITGTARVIAAAVALATPLLVARFLADVAVGVIARAAPRFPLPLVAVPVRALATLAVLVTAIGVMAVALAGETRVMLRAMADFLAAWVR